ncbi:MAG TPA: hypothetical protein DCG28_05190 [Lachnospiraceae bacterium]|nr:hypothetical protein [Lachnospiraceae bacterium]
MIKDWFEKAKNAILGEEEEYENEYENENEYEEEQASYNEEQESRQSMGFAKVRSFANFSRQKTADGYVAPSTPSFSASRFSSNNNSSSKVVSLNANVNIQVVVTTPATLEEAAEVCEELKDRHTVIVNLEGVEKEMAQRITDFFCGASYALNGSVQPVSNRIIIIGPYGVNITGQFKQQLEEASGLKLGPNASGWR